MIDLYPTLIDYCGLKGNHKINNEGGDLGGFSLRPFIENPKTKDWKGPNGALTLVGNYGNKIPLEEQNFSYRTIDYRYIKYSNGKEELYNHNEDPYEWKNIASDKKYKKIKKQLAAEMNQIIYSKK